MVLLSWLAISDCSSVSNEQILTMFIDYEALNSTAASAKHQGKAESNQQNW